jgi:hypothetical protein
MSRLSHFIFDCDIQHPQCLGALHQHPSLVTLEFLQNSSSVLSLTTLTPSGSFERIVIRDAPLEGGLRVNQDAFNFTNYDMLIEEGLDNGSHLSDPYDLLSLMALVKNSSRSLRHLEIETSIFFHFSREELDLPKLHTLILYGTTFDSTDLNVMSFLAGMPSLEDLQFLLKLNYDTGFRVIPRRYRGRITAENLALTHPSLRSLTLSNANFEDAIFSLLPPTVRRVSLPQIGSDRIELMGILEVPTEDYIFSIVEALSSSAATITELHFASCTIPSPESVQRMAQLLPQLCTLTITRPHLTSENFFGTQNWHIEVSFILCTRVDNLICSSCASGWSESESASITPVAGYTSSCIILHDRRTSTL